MSQSLPERDKHNDFPFLPENTFLQLVKPKVISNSKQRTSSTEWI